MRGAIAFTLVGLCLALGASACGGDDSSDASAAVIEQLEGICEDWRKALDAGGDFPIEDFDPENPSPGDLPAVGDFFASGHPAAEEAITEIRELSPPAEIKAEVDELVLALEQGLENAKEQARAAQAAEVDAFTASLPAAMASMEAVEEAADELGTPSCVL